MNMKSVLRTVGVIALAFTTSAIADNIHIYQPTFIESAVMVLRGYEAGALWQFYPPGVKPTPPVVKISDRIVRIQKDSRLPRPADFEQSADDPCIVLEKQNDEVVATWNFSRFPGPRSAEMYDATAILDLPYNAVAKRDCKWTCSNKLVFGSIDLSEASSFRRLAALEYIRANFCAGLPQPPLVIKPY